MKQILRTILSLVIVINTAFAGTPERNLEALIADYQYTVSVEWDQLDPKVLSSATDSFFQDLEAEGFSKEELLDWAKSYAGTQSVNELASEFSGLKKSELSALVLEKAAQNSMKGASWNGTNDMGIIGGVVVVAIVAWAVVSTSK